MWPAIIGTEEVGVARTKAPHGNGAPGGRVGSGESAIVSSSAIFLTTACGSVMRIPFSASLMMERSVGSVLHAVFSRSCAEEGFKGPVRPFNTYFKEVCSVFRASDVSGVF